MTIRVLTKKGGKKMRLDAKTPGVRPKTILVFGAGGHAKEIVSAITALGHNAIIHTNRPEDGQKYYVEDLKTLRGYDGFVVAIGDNYRRRCRYDDLLKAGLKPAEIVHPTAWVSPTAALGDGTYVGPMAVVHSNVEIGEGCIINTAAVVSHDCVISPFCHIAPGAVLCGGVVVGFGALVGAGSVIKPGIRVGDCARIGAGAAAIRLVEQDTTVVGVPAEVLHEAVAVNDNPDQGGAEAGDAVRNEGRTVRPVPTEADHGQPEADHVLHYTIGSGNSIGRAAESPDSVPISSSCEEATNRVENGATGFRQRMQAGKRRAAEERAVRRRRADREDES